MTKEDKQLLLIDLCARLPYGVKCQMEDKLIIDYSPFYDCTLTERYIELFRYHKDFYIKPYLRPLSSMTEEEKKEFIDAVTWEANRKFYIDECEDITFYQEKYDWLNAHHFDYRGLIPKGLAIEVTEENNPYKI